MNVLIAPHFERLARTYHTFVFGVEGIVVRNRAMVPETADVLSRLIAMGKIIIFLENTADLSPILKEKLDRAHVPPNLYHYIYTSADHAHHHLRHRHHPFHRQLGSSCFFIGGHDQKTFLTGLDLRVTNAMDHNPFIIMADIPFVALDDTVPFDMDLALKRRLPMICLDPSLYHLADDRCRLGAGSLAHGYESRGGFVFFHGKPHTPIYDQLRADMPTQGGTLMVGTTLADVRGALRHGFDCLCIISPLTVKDLTIETKNIKDDETDQSQIHTERWVVDRLRQRGIFPLGVACHLEW